MNAKERLQARVEPLRTRYDMFPAGGTVLCAVSGGVDSMCLLYFLRDQAERRGFTLRACHFDHAMRPSSAADAEFVRRWCEKWDIPLDTTRRDAAAWAAEHRLGGEEAGRRLRYAWFEALAEQYEPCAVATAHTADDNAETLLLHLVRGSGLNGLGGIPPRRDWFVRPFLDVPRTLILAYAAEQHIPHVEDETNADAAYTPRNRIRADVLPLLRQLNPNLTETLSASAASLRQDEAFLAQTAARVFEENAEKSGGRVRVSVSCLRSCDPAVAARVVQRMAETLEADLVLSARQRQATAALWTGEHPGGTVSLPRGVVVRRIYDELEFSRVAPAEVLPVVALDFVGARKIGPWQVTVEYAPCPEGWHSREEEFYLSADAPVTLRPRRTGDSLCLPHREGTKTLKKWFIERHIPAHRREIIPVLEQNGVPAAVVGLGTARQAMPETGRACFRITVIESEKTEEG